MCSLLVLMALAHAQDPEKVTVPKSMLTADQMAQLKSQGVKTEVHEWAGIGREVGEAVNSSLTAITTQSNNFAQTPVGRLTVFIVIWKVIGDQALHVFGFLVELFIFLPIWLWSFRRICFTRRVKTGKDTWEVMKYDRSGEMSPRVAHMLIAFGLFGAMMITLFSY